MEPGQVVISLAGRDKGKLYLIIGFIGGNRVLLADGRCRTVNSPKKKNLKHLQPYRNIFPEIKERVRHDNLNDNLLRNILNILHSDEKTVENSGCLRTSSSDGC